MGRDSRGRILWQERQAEQARCKTCHVKSITWLAMALPRPLQYAVEKTKNRSRRPKQKKRPNGALDLPAARFCFIRCRR